MLSLSLLAVKELLAQVIVVGVASLVGGCGIIVVGVDSSVSGWGRETSYFVCMA